MIGTALGAAFVGGLLAKLAGLPPLVGFLLAGLALRTAGLEPDASIDSVAHAGVLILLFSVGLKLRLKSLASADVLCGALLHLLIFGVILAVSLMIGTAMSPPVAVAVALSLGLSSTVVAAKVLEENGNCARFTGASLSESSLFKMWLRCLLLSVVTGVAPSWWALVLAVAIVVGTPLVHRLLQWCGHGELVVVFGLTMTLAVGGAAFTTVGLSPELGALLMGTVLASHAAANELSYRLWSLKEVLLVGFFVSIGMAVDPTADAVLVALLLALLLPLKAALFFTLLVRFRLRARSSFLAAVALASFSEFGLIVAKLIHEAGLLSDQWLSVISLAAALSFIIAAPLNRMSHPLFERWREWLTRFERSERHPDDEPISLGSAEVVVFGMGRVGTGAYDYLKSQHARVVGFDSDPGKVERHLGLGRRVVYADAEDPDLWGRLSLDKVRSVMLTLPDLDAKNIAVQLLRRDGYRGHITATNVFEAEAQPILDAGCDATFNYFDDAGFGFAKHSWDALNVSEHAD